MTAVTMPAPIQSPPVNPMPTRRVLGAYLNEVKYESLRMLRSPGFSIPQRWRRSVSAWMRHGRIAIRRSGNRSCITSNS